MCDIQTCHFTESPSWQPGTGMALLRCILMMCEEKWTLWIVNAWPSHLT